MEPETELQKAMFREFFIRPGDRAVAWCGLAVAIGHVLVGVLIKVLLNSFFRDFYDVLEHAGRFV
jgi:hypothetical protein